MATRTRAGGKPPASEQADLLTRAPEAGASSETDGEFIAPPEATFEKVGQILADRAAAEGDGDVSDEELDEIEAEVAELPADEVPIENPPLRSTRNVDPVLEHANAALFGKIVKAMKELKRLKKRAKNEQGNYAYTTVDDFFDEAQDILADNDLVLITDEASTGVSGYSTTNKTVGLLDSTWRFLLVLATDPDVYIGPFLRRSVAPSSMGAQAYGAVLSYAIKNYLRGQFLMATGDAEVDQTHAGALTPRPREDRGGQQRRQDPPGYTPSRQQDGQRAQQEAPRGSFVPKSEQAPPPDDDRIPMRSRGEVQPGRPAVFRLRGRLNKAGIAVERVLKSYAPAEKLEDLSDEQIRAVHKKLDDTGVEKVPGQEP